MSAERDDDRGDPARPDEITATDLDAADDPPRHPCHVRQLDLGPAAAMAQQSDVRAEFGEIDPASWEDPVLAQVWGPRHSAYVIAARDLALFTLSRLPDDAKGRRRAEETAARLHDFLDGRRMRYDDAGFGLGLDPNALRYAAPTGTILMRWEGARRPVIWSVPRPVIAPLDARKELARRYVHVFGPTGPGAFAEWAGMTTAQSRAAFAALTDELTPVRTPIGQAWILATDEPSFRGDSSPTAPVRLIPSGDPYYLLWGADRELLVPDPARQRSLWTPRVWPGALLVRGEIVGVWRRADTVVQVETWRSLSQAERQASEAEAASLPIPGAAGRISIRWET